jgi:two-component sensor histidine kinase
MHARPLRLELRLDASPDLVSVTRRFLEEALGRFVDDADLVSRAAMVAHELLENAAKYARHGKAELSLIVDGQGDGKGGGDRWLTLRLSNSTSPAHIGRLREIFSEIEGCEDPQALYVGLMRRNAHQADISGLGLARIRAEGEMTLDLQINGDNATIAAQTAMPATVGGP